LIHFCSLGIIDLPEDMQVLLTEIVGATASNATLRKLSKHSFTVYGLPITAFPVVPIWTDYRGRAYTNSMLGRNLPPVILCGRKWIDGRHRLWVWRKEGMTRVPCIDLADIGLSYKFKAITLLETRVRARCKRTEKCCSLGVPR